MLTCLGAGAMLALATAAKQKTKAQMMNCIDMVARTVQVLAR